MTNPISGVTSQVDVINKKRIEKELAESMYSIYPDAFVYNLGNLSPSLRVFFDCEDVDAIIKEIEKNDVGFKNRTCGGMTALMCVLLNKKLYTKQKLKIIHSFEKFGAEYLNIQNDSGFTALSIACSQRDTEIATFLVLSGADVNIPNKFGNTPLMISAYGNNLPLFALLYLFYADDGYINSWGLNAFDITQQRDSTEILSGIVELLVHSTMIDKNT